MIIDLWMKGVVKVPDGKRPHPPRMSETEGINLEDRGREILQGMKGWRPSALPRLDAGSGLVRQAYHMPDVGSIGLSFFRKVPGAPWTRVPFSRSSAPRRRVGQTTPEASAIMKRRQPFTSL